MINAVEFGSTGSYGMQTITDTLSISRENLGGEIGIKLIPRSVTVYLTLAEVDRLHEMAHQLVEEGASTVDEGTILSSNLQGLDRYFSARWDEVPGIDELYIPTLEQEVDMTRRPWSAYATHRLTEEDMLGIMITYKTNRLAAIRQESSMQVLKKTMGTYALQFWG